MLTSKSGDEIPILHAVCIKMIPIQWCYSISSFGWSSVKFGVA